MTRRDRARRADRRPRSGRRTPRSGRRRRPAARAPMCGRRAPISAGLRPRVWPTGSVPSGSGSLLGSRRRERLERGSTAWTSTPSARSTCARAGIASPRAGGSPSAASCSARSSACSSRSGAATSTEAESLIYLGQPFTPAGGGQLQSLQTNPKTVSEIVRSEAGDQDRRRGSGHAAGAAPGQRDLDGRRAGRPGGAELHAARPDRGAGADEAEGGDGVELVREHRRSSVVPYIEQKMKLLERADRERLARARRPSTTRIASANSQQRLALADTEPLARREAARLNELERDDQRRRAAARDRARRDLNSRSSSSRSRRTSS